MCTLVLTGIATVAAAAEETWEKSSDTFMEAVGRAGRVVVDNPHGNIWVRFGGYEDQVEIIATQQRLEPDLPKLIVRRERRGEDLEIRVAQEKSPAEPSFDRRDRIDLVLFVPIGRRVELTTVDDDIAVKGLQGDLTVRTIKGDVSLRKVTGAVNVRSEHGRVVALLESGVTESDQHIESVTGDLEITVYEDATHEVAIATSGIISTDFSLEIEHRRFEEPGKHARATIGGGGPKLSMSSKRGKVSLLRQQKFFTQQAEDPS
ncbi:MAG: hypothetical protein GTN89_13620 [Acidobacteria bacterium]|nr:hypothetical protein [Acidobacteriota bacterium]NIM60323.1 hypothetical protein [Acidobacteriota bacterium]NIQ31379.1 hypothetical protein [Acidobacteriota bacterium]NIT11976.1 hypothetical protein [Acidobacteriota bacterium]